MYHYVAELNLKQLAFCAAELYVNHLSVSYVVCWVSNALHMANWLALAVE